MLAVILAFLVGMSQFIPTSPPSAPQSPTITAKVTAFSCSQDPRNPMGACHTFANGESAIGATGVAACPREYLGGTVEIVGIGLFRCVDTMRHDVIDGHLHIDRYMGSHYGAHQEAVVWGSPLWEVIMTLPTE